jgi:hypothetical protein
MLALAAEGAVQGILFLGHFPSLTQALCVQLASRNASA